MNLNTLFSFLAISAILTTAGCSSKKTEYALPAPAGIQEVKDFVRGKKLQTKKAGFYDYLSMNGAKDLKWIDVATEKDKTTKKATAEALDFAVQFINDTAATIFKKGNVFTATYAIDDLTDEADGVIPGVKMHLSFPDPDFSMGNGMSMVTYTYYVLGLDDKKIMLETPRSINRQKIITLMSE